MWQTNGGAKQSIHCCGPIFEDLQTEDERIDMNESACGVFRNFIHFNDACRCWLLSHFAYAFSNDQKAEKMADQPVVSCAIKMVKKLE